MPDAHTPRNPNSKTPWFSLRGILRRKPARPLHPAIETEPGSPYPAKGMILIGCLLLWLGLLFAGPAQHHPTYAVGQDQPFFFHEDTQGDMSLTEFLAIPPSELTISRRPLTQGYTASAFWLRFEIPQTWFAERELWLELKPTYLDHLAVYWRPAGTSQAWRARQAGDRDDALARMGDLDYRTTVLSLAPPDTAEGYEVAIRVQSTSTVMVEPSLWQPADFLKYASRDSVFWSFHFGVGVLSSTIAVMLAVGLRSRLLWSVLPFSATYLLVACVQGFVGWSDAQWRVTLQHYLTGGLTLLGYPALLWMCTEALDLRRHFPRIYKTMLACIAIGLLLPLGIPLNLYGAAVQALTLFALLSAPILMGCSFTLWWRQGLAPLNLAFGLIPMFYVVTSLLAILTNLAVLPYDSFIFNLWQYSVMLIMMFTMLFVMTVGVYRISRERQSSLERMQLARELRVEREARFNQRQFMGMISHEFRTPLAVISGVVENLRVGHPGNERVRQRYDKIERATNRLVQLTDNCLADARLSAGTLYLDIKPVDLLRQIRYAASLAELTGDHRLRITVDGHPLADDTQISVPVHADSALLGIALSNLLGNAVKYSTPGSQVRLDVQRQANRIVIGIEDEGSGIPSELAEQIFERFRQAHVDDAAERDGWGLGLYVARQIALAHHGDLLLAANTPEGCRFEFILPGPGSSGHST